MGGKISFKSQSRTSMNKNFGRNDIPISDAPTVDKPTTDVLTNNAPTNHIPITNQANNNPSYLKEFINKSIPPAWKYLSELQRLPPSNNLSNYLSTFNVPREIDPKIFAEGVKKFITLANSNPISQDYESEYTRKKIYGNSYAGLHYNTNLAELWNNLNKTTPIKAHEILRLAPWDWDLPIDDEFAVLTLIYRGQQPAQALDKLVQGPTVIDCAMFTQLCLWFGIRYMLGNERFNQYFGRAPFFITQCVFKPVAQSDQPYSGNPLYSFLSTKEQAVIPSVILKYFANVPLYPHKHPGDNYTGENCIGIDDKYYIFDPHLENTQELTESAILNLLRHAFNADRTQHDVDRLALFTSILEKTSPRYFNASYWESIESAENLKNTKMTEEEFLRIHQGDDLLELTFDFHKFSIWLQRIENNHKCNLVDYSPRLIDHSSLPADLLNAIPFENKSMDFSKFKQETSQQKELMTIGKQFCQSVMANESKLTILTGDAHGGKTATASCIAKELAAQGKKIIWISEVMVNAWTSQVQSMAEIDKHYLKIDKLLLTNPDAIFLDDDNLAGSSGKALLEKIYTWYAKFPGKGLFITSNQPICFNECYGIKLDSKYHYPPFNDYASPQYINWQCKLDLISNSLRSRQDGQSIGAIVSDSIWKINENKIENAEFIPGFTHEELQPIRESLRKNQGTGDAYDKLRPIQKKSLHFHTVLEAYIFTSQGTCRYIPSYLTINPNRFEKTTCKTIVLEMTEYTYYNLEKQIYYHSIIQLISILNYAHDQGGRRVILINKTSFSHEQLLDEIKKQLPKAERERTWSRLMLLLCENEESIFKHDEFNGHIGNIVPEKKAELGVTSKHRFPFFESRRPSIFSNTNDPPSNKTIV